jgi:cytochrome c
MKPIARPRRILILALLIVATAAAVAGCGSNVRAPEITVAGGDPETGATLIEQWGCGSCHTIPGIRKANGLVGPTLAEFGSRAYIAGNMTNNPDNLVRWIMDPQEIEPGTVMPDLNVTDGVARHMAAYLYTLRR